MVCHHSQIRLVENIIISKIPPPRDKKLRLLTKIIAVSIVSTGLIISLGGGVAMAEYGQGDSDFSYDDYSARQIKDIANCISGVDTSTRLCAERGSQGWYDWAEQNLRDDTRGQFTMMGDTVEIRLVGINVDNRADGKGKAGLTFMTTTYIGESPTSLADTDNNAGGYRDVRNRKNFNQGQYKSTISDNVYKYLTPVLKIQGNQADGNDYMHSATSNATVEKISIPSPLELNMNVTRDKIGGSNYNGLAPTGIRQYNPKGWWGTRYGYLYSGNAPYEYYQNNTSDVSEYCKLIKGDGTYSRKWGPCNDVSSRETYIWLRSVIPSNFKHFAIFSNWAGSLFMERPNKLEAGYITALFNF